MNKVADHEKELSMARSRYNTNKNKEKTASLKEDIDRISAEVQADRQKGDLLRPPWEEEVQRHEPKLIHDLRERLVKNPSITETFDPWYMVSSTRDNGPTTANAQLDGNEVTHRNHLHITLSDSHLI